MGVEPGDKCSDLPPATAALTDTQQAVTQFDARASAEVSCRVHRCSGSIWIGPPGRPGFPKSPQQEAPLSGANRDGRSL